MKNYNIDYDILRAIKGLYNNLLSIGGRPITNLRFADDIDGIAGSEKELRQLVERLVKTSDDYGMEINVGKTKK